jgi:(S)-2-hydroxyglutarate dehydrogenase
VIYDFSIIGGGIIGATVAWHLKSENTNLSIALLEKESKLSMHQSGHNSGVVHSGIYYQPGSLKAKFCSNGLKDIYYFCDKYGLPYDKCGKLIIATNNDENKELSLLYQRAKTNGADVYELSSSDLSGLEPNIVGTKAIFSPNTGIVNYSEIVNKVGSLSLNSGVEIITNFEVSNIIEKTDNVELISQDERSIKAKNIVVCGGAQSDRLATISGLDPKCRIVPFRGEYYKLPLKKNNIIKHLIYPTPSPKVPFLGVHLTRTIDGGIIVGPNAVLSFSRDEYKKLSFKFGDFASTVSYAGFWSLLWNHKSHIKTELFSYLSKKYYLKECRKYCPSLELDDLTGYYSGVRAQAVDRKGVLIHDFRFIKTNRMFHVINAPSPAATSSFSIAKHIVGEILN